jgi:hypothetical protein
MKPAPLPANIHHMTNKETEDTLRVFLQSRGFNLSPKLEAPGANGTDIIASKTNHPTYHIEVIGYKRSASARSRDFYEACFRCLSRLKLGADKVVMACPFSFCLGLDQRVQNMGDAWLRLGKSFPELELWFVYPQGTQISYGSWNYWGRESLHPREHSSMQSNHDRFGPPTADADEAFHAKHQQVFAHYLPSNA